MTMIEGRRGAGAGGCRRSSAAESRKLVEINQSFDDVLGGRVPARLVIEF
jgi:hypothetical protein